MTPAHVRLQDLNRPRTGVVAGFEDLADPDHYRVAAYARLLAYRQSVLRDNPHTHRFPDPGEFRATTAAAYVFTTALARNVAAVGEVTTAHTKAAGYIAAAMRRAQQAAAGVIRFGPGVCLFDADTLDRITRAVHRGVCTTGAEHPGACHRDPWRVRLRPAGDTRTRREPGCVVHAGADLAALTAAGTEVEIIGPAAAAQAVRGYAGELRAAAIRGWCTP
jgi:hypothetical protein